MLSLTPAGDEDPTVRELIAELQQEYVIRYGGTDDDPVDIADFTPPTGLFLLARTPDGELVGSVALRRHDAGTAELKRMYVRPAHRRRGLGRELVVAIEQHARDAGYTRIILVTGPNQPEALALYEEVGYERVPNFGFYAGSTSAMSYAKTL